MSIDDQDTLDKLKLDELEGSAESPVRAPARLAEVETERHVYNHTTKL